MAPGRLAGQTNEAQSIDAWVDRLGQAAGALFACARRCRVADRGPAPAPRMTWPAQPRPAPDSSAIPLTFTDIRKLLDERLASLVGRPDFFRGGVTVTSMTPLRWVPYRVVCLLGMDQWAFASVPASGDDLAAGSPRIGDRDPRGEVRQSLLEAVLAAGDHLLVFRDGRDVRTNQKVPRAVVTAELFEAVSAVVEAGQREEFAEHLELNHPRHPFDDRCFEVGALVDGAPWGFDGTDFRGAEARRNRAAALLLS